jgi:hypothetical protein
MPKVRGPETIIQEIDDRLHKAINIDQNILTMVEGVKNGLPESNMNDKDKLGKIIHLVEENAEGIRDDSGNR